MESINYKGFTININQDSHPRNPLQEDCGNIKYALFHKRHNLQNDTELKSEDYTSWDKLKKALVRQYKALEVLPIYMYDHSGQTIATTPFSCKMDSGQIGFAFINKEVLNEWGFKSRKGYEGSAKQTLEEAIIQNVKVYDDYITGNVWEFEVVNSEDEILDSCSGYFGDLGKEQAIEEAKAFIDSEVEEQSAMLTNEVIADNLLSDIEAYKENIKEIIIGGLTDSTHQRIYWDAWFRGAKGEDLENADGGVIFKLKVGDSVTYKLPYLETYLTYNGVVKTIEGSYARVEYKNGNALLLSTHIPLINLVKTN